MTSTREYVRVEMESFLFSNRAYEARNGAPACIGNGREIAFLRRHMDPVTALAQIVLCGDAVIFLQQSEGFP